MNHAKEIRGSCDITIFTSGTHPHSMMVDCHLSPPRVRFSVHDRSSVHDAPRRGGRLCLAVLHARLRRLVEGLKQAMPN